jgi:hypothetical protein
MLVSRILRDRASYYAVVNRSRCVMNLRFQNKGRITFWEVTNVYKGDALSAEFLPHTPGIYDPHHPELSQ